MQYFVSIVGFWKPIYISQPFQYAKKKLHLPKYWFPILINMKRSDRMVSFFSNFQLKLKFILSQKMIFPLFPIVGKCNTLVPFDLKTTFYSMYIDVEKMVRFLMNDQIWPLKALWYSVPFYPITLPSVHLHFFKIRPHFKG